MANERVSNERLAEMLRYWSETSKRAATGHGMNLREQEMVSALFELQALRSTHQGEVEFEGVAKRKLDDLLARGWEISGYSLFKDGDHGLITKGGFVGWFSVAERNAALQPSVPKAGESEQIEALMRERTSLIETKREQMAELTEQRNSYRDGYMRLAKQAELENKALREALKPFADLGEVVLAEAPPDAEAAWSFQSSDGPHLITLDAFRAAIAALVQP